MSRFGLRVPVWTETSVAGVYGRDRVEGVLVRGPGGTERSVAVDTVVFTGDFIPDSELARLAGVSIDPGTRGPACAADGVTTAPGIFAAGNVVHPAETADVAARRAWSVGRAAAAWLRDGADAGAWGGTAPVRVSDPLHWVVPEQDGSRPRRGRAGPDQVTGLPGPSPRGRDPGWSAPGLPSAASHDPEPVARPPVRLAGAPASR